MITDLEIKRAMKRCAAVYPAPREADNALKVWRAVLTDKRKHITPEELDHAVTAYLDSSERFFPAPGVLWEEYIRATRGSPSYHRDDPPADPDGFSALREAFERATGKSWDEAKAEADRLRAGKR